MYRLLFELFLRRLEPEKAHLLAARTLRLLPRIAPVLEKFSPRIFTPPKQLETRVLGLDFATPFGLAAGFDKNAEMIPALACLGFGHVEVGTVTRYAQPGNDRPRLFRLTDERALINRMGFNNHGTAPAIEHIEQALLSKYRPVIGVNIGKSRKTALEDAIGDYVWSAERALPVADYIAINVSSPNTPGLRSLQNVEALRPLLECVRETVENKPLLVKIAPDLHNEDILAIVDLAHRVGLNGIIATNTTISRDVLQNANAKHAHEAGGLSGRPLRNRSLEILRNICTACENKELAVISVGGVTDAQDVAERLIAGADLVQGFTAFIYEGPLWARKINRDLVGMLGA